MIDGRILTSQSDIKREAATHFETFLNGGQQGVTSVSQEQLRQLVDHQCSSADAARLQALVQAAEIKKVLFSMPANKALARMVISWNSTRRLGR